VCFSPFPSEYARTPITRLEEFVEFGILELKQLFLEVIAASSCTDRANAHRGARRALLSDGRGPEG
jgi:hypothetical protein